MQTFAIKALAVDCLIWLKNTQMKAAPFRPTCGDVGDIFVETMNVQNASESWLGVVLLGVYDSAIHFKRYKIKTPLLG